MFSKCFSLLSSILCFAVWSSRASAHSLAEALYEPLPEGLFEYKLDWDPTLVFFLLFGIFYARGMRAFRGPLPIARWQVACFYAGITINILSLIPPIDPLSDRLFFMHMIQHMLIINVGVPLMILGVPFFITVRGFSPWLRRKVYFPIIRQRSLRRLNWFLLQPLVALALFEINFWIWHVPRLYNLALLNDLIHIVEHACMAVTALYLWRNIIDPYPMRCPLHMGFRLLFLAAIMALNTILSAALTFSEEIWYAYEGIPMPQWWEAQWTHLDDQRLGGLIMWVPGGFCLFVMMSISFFVWVRREGRENGKPLMTRPT